MATVQNIDLDVGEDAIWTIELLPVVNISGWQLQFQMTPLGLNTPIGSGSFPLPTQNIWPGYYVQPPGQTQTVGPLPQIAVVTKDNILLGGLVITNGPGGIFQITIHAADTVNLPVGTYAWKVTRVDSGNNVRISNGYIALGT